MIRREGGFYREAVQRAKLYRILLSDCIFLVVTAFYGQLSFQTSATFIWF